VRGPHDTLRDYIRAETSATSYWSNFPAFIVSQLKAWFGNAATGDNDYCFDYLPQITGDHSRDCSFHHARSSAINPLTNCGAGGVYRPT